MDPGPFAYLESYLNGKKCYEYEQRGLWWCSCVLLLLCHLSSLPSSPLPGRTFLKLKPCSLPYFSYCVCAPGGCFTGTVWSLCCDWQLGTLGAGNHYAEIQVVDDIYNEYAARKMGIDHKGQVCVMIHSGSRGLGHQVATGMIWLACVPWVKQTLQHDLVTDRKFQHQKYHFLPLVKSIPSCLARGCLAFCLLDFASLSAMIRFKPKW